MPRDAEHVAAPLVTAVDDVVERLPLSSSGDAANTPKPFSNHHLVQEPTAVPPNVWRIHGRDYDLTSFVDDHPGGALFILMGKGLDCTHFFEFYHLFSVPRERLRAYDVTPDGDKPPVPECDSAFMNDVRRMAREHFDQTSFRPGRHKASVLQWALMIGMLVGECYFIWRWLAPPDGSVGAGALAAYLNWLLMCNLMHDGCHAALSTRPWVNHLGQLLGAAPWSCGQAQWWLQHVVSHHPNINQLGLDIDAHHFVPARWHRAVPPEIAPKPGSTFRGRAVPWRAAIAGAHQLACHVLAYLFATVSMVHVYTGLFVFLPYFGPRYFGAADERDLPTPSPRHGLGAPRPPGKFGGQFPRLAGNFGRQGVLGYYRSVLWANVGAWLLAMAMLFLPPVVSALRAADAAGGWEGLTSEPPTVLVALVGGLARGLLLALVPVWVTSLCFMMITQVSHIQEECQEAETLNEPDPFKRQAQTSLDYNPASWLTRFLTGGLNLQSIHHVMPSVSCVHYPALYPKFLAICEAHGCVPQRADSFVHAVYKHWRYVYRLGRGDDFLADAEADGYPGFTGVRAAA